MFSGIIKNTGKINKIYKKDNNCYIEISSKMKFAKSEIGSSVSCSGACLTVEKFNRNTVKFFDCKKFFWKEIDTYKDLYDMRRIIRKINPFKSDRRHIHHILIDLGFAPISVFIIITILNHGLNSIENIPITLVSRIF